MKWKRCNKKERWDLAHAGEGRVSRCSAPREIRQKGAEALNGVLLEGDSVGFGMILVYLPEAALCTWHLAGIVQSSDADWWDVHSWVETWTLAMWGVKSAHDTGENLIEHYTEFRTLKWPLMLHKVLCWEFKYRDFLSDWMSSLYVCPHCHCLS